MSSHGLSSETAFKILCRLSRTVFTAEEITAVSSCSFDGTDWKKIIQLAEHHGVLPLVARNLIEYSKRLPPAIESELQEAHRVSLIRGLWFSSELVSIMRRFEAEQIPALPFKGPVLAQSAYGDSALRNFSDLDFLVSASNVQRAKRSLADIGYRSSKQLSSAVEQFWLRNGYEQCFDGPAGQHLVELQWALLPRFYSVDLPVEALLARARNVTVGNKRMLCLSPEDSLLALSIHAAKHLWGRLIWLVDIAETVRAETLDYNLLRSNANKLGVARMVAVTFWLAQSLLDLSLPPIAQEMIDHDPNVAALGELFADRISRSATYNFESTEYFKFIFRLRERRRDRIRYSWRLLSTPGQSDLDAVKLPEVLFPLYRMVRVARLLRRRSRKLAPVANQ